MLPHKFSQERKPVMYRPTSIKRLIDEVIISARETIQMCELVRALLPMAGSKARTNSHTHCFHRIAKKDKKVCLIYWDNSLATTGSPVYSDRAVMPRSTWASIYASTARLLSRCCIRAWQAAKK